MIIQTTKIYNNRTTIPKEVRKRLGIEDGDKVVWKCDLGKSEISIEKQKKEEKNRFSSF